MGHPDSGTILALMDGELPDPEAAEVRAHVDRCPSCIDLAQELGQTSQSVQEALASLDVEPDLDGPRQAIRAQSRGPGAARTRQETRSSAKAGGGSWIRWSLPKAASIAVFLSAGVASALPGSPVRDWVSDWLTGPGSETGSSEAGLDAPAVNSQVQESLDLAAGVTAYQGSVEIWIHELPDPAELLVRWVDGDEAWIQAGEGTRFNTSEGRLEAFSPPGSIEVELPRGIERVELRLNGAVLLRKQGGELEILEPTQQRTPSEILFGSQVGTNEGSG